MTVPDDLAPRAFDLCGPLPTGTTVLEASAGTGKTHAIAGLAARYLAEGHARIQELMLVTFGRAATAELRERVRERLLEVAAAMADPAAARAGGDPLIRLLLHDTAPDEVAARRDRLETALADFDAATIATTHGFSHQMLTALGMAAGIDPALALTADARDLLEDVVTDLYAAAHAGVDGRPPLISVEVARRVAAAAANDPAARLEPAHLDPREPDHQEPAARYAFASRARSGLAARKRAARLMDFDDLVGFLRDALADPVTGGDACQRIRDRYRVVLVDEFQDTDPVQWEILRRAFHGHTTLVLVGDPKQAIYAFRGGDVDTYLFATRGAHVQTLGMNWRSDGPLVEALARLWNGVALGRAEIVVRPVAAAHRERSLRGPGAGAPLRIRVLPRVGTPPHRPMTVAGPRDAVARDVAADIVRLLTSGAGVVAREGAAAGRAAARPVSPGDIAILVATNKDARRHRDALQEAGVPVVLTGTSSVFLTPAAEQWLTLLTALAQPTRPDLVRAAALTDFIGWDATRLATAPDVELDVLSLQVRGWAGEVAARGIAALTQEIWATSGVVPRALARHGGERDLTDLRHIGEALHAAQVANRGGLAFLGLWLRDRIREAEGDAREERSRRLDSDTLAVQVLTVHSAKGLQFPVVYAPCLWDGNPSTRVETVLFHDDAGARVLDVGKGGPDFGRHSRRFREELQGEQLRLAYVALTRARSQVVVHWAPTNNTGTAPLHRLLFGDRRLDGSLPGNVEVPSDERANARLDALAQGAGGLIAVELVGPPGATPPWRPHAEGPPELEVRSFGRQLDHAWARLSYSGLTRAVHEPGRAGAAAPWLSEPERWGGGDEPDLAAAAPPPVEAAALATAELLLPDPATTFSSPLAGWPGGTAFGTVVHSLLEAVDFTAPDLPDRLASAAARLGGVGALGVPPASLAAALQPALGTPLGPLAGNRRLTDIPARDRLDELEFELPLAGGDAPRGRATLAGLAGLVHRHLPPSDPLAGWADDLAALGTRDLRGFLTGSIDLALRVPGDAGSTRYVVVDYKTNWLGTGRPGTGPLTAWDYRGSAMAAAMRAAHYPLQALLYSVALHRFLRWRLPGYDPAAHLGGVLYLFVRGMCGPDTPVVEGMRCGVFAWRPPAALVAGVSDLLDGGES